jgi:uncharacterized membrane protein YfcA
MPIDPGSIIPQLLFLLIAFIPSVVGAISGIGGGIIIKPVLDTASGILATPGLTVRQISFLSGCTVLSMATVSVLRTLIDNSQGKIRFESRRCVALAAGAAFGGLTGKGIFDRAITGSGDSIGAVQSVILILLSAMVFVYTLQKGAIKTHNIKNLPLCAGLGFVLGMISAFLGIGGGPINIMAISYCLSLDSKSTSVYSLFTVFLSQLASLLLTVATGAAPDVHLFHLGFMIIGGITGALTGQRIVRVITNRGADQIFCAVLLVVMGISGYNVIGFYFL